MTKVAPVALTEVIDGQRTTRLQFIVAAICGAVTFADAYSIQAVNFAGPSLRAALSLTPVQLGAVFSLSLLGMMLGGFVIGPISDRIGRRTPLVALTLAFGLITMLTAWTTEFWQLAACRLADGLALGAALPNAYVLAAEYSPIRSRRLTIGLMMVGYTAGGLAAGLAAGPLIAAFGWQAIFVFGGCMAILVAAAAWRWLPESLHILLRDPRNRSVAERIIARISPEHIGSIDSLVVPVRAAPGASVAVLFSTPFKMITLALWTLAFMAMFDVFIYLSWTPILIKDRGIALENAILITAMFNVGTILSAVATGWLMDRIKPAVVLLHLLGCGAIALVNVSLADGNATWLMLASACVGIGLGGALGGMNLLATTVYPSEARVTGAGWAISVGRVGSVIGPSVGALAINAGMTSADIYLAMLVPIALAAGTTILLAQRIR